jgi:PKD repeat protein
LPNFYQGTTAYNPTYTPNFTFNNACADSVINFNNTATSSQTAIAKTEWDLDNGAGFSINNTMSFTHTFNLAKNYTIKQKITTNGGCVAETSKTLTIYPNPVIDFTNSGSYKDSVISFTATASTSIGSAQWLFNGVDALSGSSVTKTFTDTGNVAVKLTLSSTAGCTNTLTKNIRIIVNSLPLSLSDDGVVNLIKIYPNPSKDDVFIEVPTEGTVQIYTTTGVLVANKSVGIGENTISTTNFSQGSYIIRLQLSGKTYHFQFLKL